MNKRDFKVGDLVKWAHRIVGVVIGIERGLYPTITVHWTDGSRDRITTRSDSLTLISSVPETS